MSTTTVPQDNYVHIRIDAKDSGAKYDRSASSSGIEFQVPNVTSSNSGQFYAVEKSKSCSKISERAKQKSWYNVIYPSYKARSEQFKKLFKDVPDDQRLIVGRFYSYFKTLAHLSI